MSAESFAAKLVTDLLKALPTMIKDLKDLVDQEQNGSGENSGDGRETMPDDITGAYVFFTRYCSEVDIWPASPSDVKWATPMLVFSDGWTVKRWVNPMGAKHLFIVSPKQKVYASTWAWGPVKHKVDLLEQSLLQHFSPEVSIPDIPKPVSKSTTKSRRRKGSTTKSRERKGKEK
jgi:hypothetical protein